MAAFDHMTGTEAAPHTTTFEQMRRANARATEIRRGTAERIACAGVPVLCSNHMRPNGWAIVCGSELFEEVRRMCRTEEATGGT